MIAEWNSESIDALFAIVGALTVIVGAIYLASLGWERFLDRRNPGRRSARVEEGLREQIRVLENRGYEITPPPPIDWEQIYSEPSLAARAREGAEEQASDDYEGRLVTDGGVRQPSGAYLMPDGRLVAPKNPKPYPTSEGEPSVVEQPSTGPRVRREEFRQIIERDGLKLYVDGFYEVRDEEDEPREDEPSTWTISIPIPPPPKDDEL